MSTRKNDRTGPPADPAFVLDPVASPSGRFPLARPAGLPASEDEPSALGVRPWNLRRMGSVMFPTGRLAALRYDSVRQISFDPNGHPITDGAFLAGGAAHPYGPVTAGPPTAPTTSITDGEDPPSSEDWINDFHPDDLP